MKDGVGRSPGVGNESVPAKNYFHDYFQCVTPFCYVSNWIRYKMWCDKRSLINAYLQCK